MTVFTPIARPKTTLPDFVHRNGQALGLAALLILVATPFLMIRNLVLLDYQNHLARLYLIMDADHPYSALKFYEVNWSRISTDIGLDLLAQTLKGTVSSEALGRAALVASAILPPLGAIALNAAAFRRLSVHQFAIPFFGWSLTALAGFLNFQIGLGLAFSFAALVAWVPADRPAPRLAISMAGGLVVYLFHALDFALFIVLIVALNFETVTDFGTGRPSRTEGVVRPRVGHWGRALLAASACLLPVLAVIVVSQTLPGNQEPGVAHGTTYWNSPHGALAAVLSPFIGYGTMVDGALGLGMAATLVAAAVLARRRAHAGLLAIAVLMACVSPFMPLATPHGGWTDRRMPIMAVLAILASVQFDLPSRRTAVAVAAACVGLAVMRTGWVGWNLFQAQSLYDAAASAISGAAPNSRILPLQDDPTDAEVAARPVGRFFYGHNPTFEHLPLAAIRLRGAFVPNLFTQRGVHPVHVRPAFEPIAWPEGGELASVNALGRPELIAWDTPYIRVWRTHFDYVLVLNSDYPDRNGPVRIPPELVLVRDAGFAKLFRIEHSTFGATQGAQARQPVAPSARGAPPSH
jgi:hypothetical protein